MKIINHSDFSRVARKLGSVNRYSSPKVLSLVTLSTLFTPVRYVYTHNSHSEAQVDPKASYSFDSHSHSIAHPSKAKISVSVDKYFDGGDANDLISGAGEDSVMKLNNVLGVADGVGGWSFYQNGNSALYSRLLMHFLARYFDSKDISDLNQCEKLQNAIKYAHESTNNNKIMGSSTLCLCTMKGNQLTIANLGDSGFILLRDGKSILHSEEQTIGFNCPNQLGPHPEDTRPCDFYTATVKPGDMVILFTDGVSDNVFKEEIVSIVNELQNNPQKIADKIAKMAKSLSESQRKSPFEVNARDAGMVFNGGKPDDISVVVGVVADKTLEKDVENCLGAD